MRIRLIIYGFIIALALDVGLNDGRYLKMALRSAQYGGDRIGAEVDNGLSPPFRKAARRTQRLARGPRLAARQPKTHPFGVERFGLEWVMEFVLAIAKPSAAKKVAVVNTATAMARRRNMAGVNIGAFPSAHARFGHEGS